MSENEIQWANGIILKKDCMYFCPKIIFHMNEF
jgi:hypothetical protein